MSSQTRKITGVVKKRRERIDEIRTLKAAAQLRREALEAAKKQSDQAAAKGQTL
jgi:hypothetical protein